MIRVQELPSDSTFSIVRFFNDPNAGAFAEFDLVATIEWERHERTAWIHGMKGHANRYLLRELVDYLVSQGVRTIKAKRAAQKILPRGKVMQDGSIEIDIADLVKRQPHDTNWSPLT